MQLRKNTTISVPWQLVRVPGANGSPRYFVRSETGQWGEVITSLALADEVFDVQMASVWDGGVWVGVPVDTNDEFPLADVPLVPEDKVLVVKLSELDSDTQKEYSDSRSADSSDVNYQP